MRQNPFLFESENSEYENSEYESQFEDSFEFFENEGEDEAREYEDEYTAADYEGEYDETQFEGEFGRGGRGRSFAARAPRAGQSRARFSNRQPQRPQQQRRSSQTPRSRQSRPNQSRSRQPRSNQPRPRRPRYPVYYPLPYYSSRALPTFADPFSQSSGMVSLLQSLLNKTLGLNLPVDGVMNVETRSAIRSFQNQPGAPSPADGGGDAGNAPAPSESAPPEPNADDKAQEEFAFEFYNPASNYIELEDEYYSQEMFEAESTKPASPFRYVKSFASSDAECADAFRRAKKTRAQALTIVNQQIGQAIRMLRVAAARLKRGSRSAKTKAIFKKIFRVAPEFVPGWLKQTATIKDRGDVVATRCRRVADMLERGGLRYFCTIGSPNCHPACTDPSIYACSSFGSESTTMKDKRVVCLGTAFWDAMGQSPVDLPNILAVLMHEPFHIFYGTYVTQHDPRVVNGNSESVGKFGGIYCITQFVFEINGRTNYPAWMKRVCDDTTVRN